MAELVKEAKLATPEHRKQLIPNNKVLKEVLSEMSKGEMPPGKEKLHAAVLAHLSKQLEPRDSGVPGVSLPGFSHIRIFESVVPDNFEPSSSDEVIKLIIKNSLEYAKKPKGPAPPDAFTVDQFHAASSPPEDPDIPAPVPNPLIQGRDFANNHLVGLRAEHQSMSDLVAMMKKIHMEPLTINRHENDWAHTAWLVSMMQVEPEKLEKQLTEQAKAHGQYPALKAHITKIRRAAEDLHAAMHVDGNRADQNKVNHAMQSVINDTRDEMHELTQVLLSSKADIRDDPLLESDKNHTHVASLMSILGAECIIMKPGAGESKDTPSEVTFHSAEMQGATAAFAAEDPGKQGGFFTEKMKSTPVVVVNHDGSFELRMPASLARPAETGGDGASVGNDRNETIPDSTNRTER